MAIPLVRESEEDRKEWGSVKEICYFCPKTTIHWHWRTNQPVCPECAKVHKVGELKKSHPNYKPPTKAEYQNK